MTDLFRPTDLSKALRRGLDLPVRRRPDTTGDSEPRRQSSSITIGALRAYGVTSLIADCGDIRCNHRTKMAITGWADDVEIANLNTTLLCTECGRQGCYVKPDWSSASKDTAK